MDSKVICCCHNVTVEDIKEEIKNKVRTFSELQERTQIGTDCPPCTVESEKVFNNLLNEYLEK